MRIWKPAAAIVCTCLFLAGEAGELKRIASGTCLVHRELCAEDPVVPLHMTDSITLSVISTST